MALDKISLKNGIKKLLEDCYNMQDEQTPEEAREYFATGLSNLIDVYVKTGTVSTVVTTTGGNGTGVGNVL